MGAGAGRLESTRADNGGPEGSSPGGAGSNTSRPEGSRGELRLAVGVAHMPEGGRPGSNPRGSAGPVDSNPGACGNSTSMSEGGLGKWRPVVGLAYLLTRFQGVRRPTPD